MRTSNYLSIAITALLLHACSSSSDGGNSTSTTNQFPTFVDQRIVSISTDIDKDGSIDQIERFSYDEMDRISISTTEFTDTGSKSTTEYIYSDNNLVEIKRDQDSDQYLYNNGRVVTHLYIDGFDERYNTQTSYIYDSNGRLTSALGDPGLYDSDDCNLTGLAIDASEPLIGLNLAYSGNRLSTITSDDGAYTATFNFNNANQFSGLIETYNCEEFGDAQAIVGFELPYEFTSELSITYDNAGRAYFISSFEDSYGSESEIIYGSDGRPTNQVTTYYDGTPTFDERTTQTYTYNAQGQISTIESTTEDNSTSFFTTPNYISTLEYEDKRCVVALAVDPLKLATLETIGSASTLNTRNEAALCAYPLE